jgi:hypothetical protein
MGLDGYDEWKLSCPPEYEREDDREIEERPELTAAQQAQRDADNAYAVDLAGHVRGCKCVECRDVEF